jgi:hypothetical protein
MLDEVDEERVFTLSEARSLIPKLRRLLARVTSERESLVSMRVEIDRAREKAQMGGGSRLGPTYLALVDFPYEREGRIVYLCWKPDEDEIGWWHETDSGFVGRQPLTEDFD